MVVSVILSLTFEMPFQELWKTYDQNQKGKTPKLPYLCSAYYTRILQESN